VTVRDPTLRITHVNGGRRLAKNKPERDDSMCNNWPECDHELGKCPDGYILEEDKDGHNQTQHPD